MPADGIAYNHYGIKYVLKRLGDQRRSQGSIYGRWRETGDRKRGGEQLSTGSTHIYMGREIKGVCVRGMRSTEIQRPPRLLIIALIGRIGDFPDETQQ